MGFDAEAPDQAADLPQLDLNTVDWDQADKDMYRQADNLSEFDFDGVPRDQTVRHQAAAVDATLAERTELQLARLLYDDMESPAHAQDAMGEIRLANDIAAQQLRELEQARALRDEVREHTQCGGGFFFFFWNDEAHNKHHKYGVVSVLSI